MEIKPIRTVRDHGRALREVEKLWGALPGTPRGDRMDVLVTLIEVFEQTHYPISPPDPLEAIRFRLEQQGLGPRDLIGVIGSRTRVYEVLRGSRSLTLPMIQRLHDQLGIPAEVLIQPVKKKTPRAA